MNRRTLLYGLGVGLLAAPLAAEAQKAGKIARVGFLSESDDPGPERPDSVRPFPVRTLLHSLGWVEGRNLEFVSRHAQNRSERLPDLAAELVALKLDVIIAQGSQEALALKRATSVTPIVMYAPGDPVAAGLVSSLARPGGNITGTSLMFPDAAGKRLELLRELVPSVSQVAVLWNPQNPSTTMDWRETQRTAQVLGLRLHSHPVERAEAVPEALKAVGKEGSQALVLLQDSVVVVTSKTTADFAIANRLPTISAGEIYVRRGVLIGYGPSLAAVGARTVTYVDRILRGAKPGDLPIEQPAKFDLVINLKTAKALGLTIPQSLLLRADQVIE